MKILKLAIVIVMSITTSLSLISCGNNSSQANNGKLAENELPNGEKIYLKYCKLCHGVDGNLELNGAADLSESTLEKEELTEVIRNGRNTMQPYKELLNEEKIKAVADYVMKLRGK